MRTAISDPHATSHTIAQITQQDPAITAQLIKVANSPLFRGVKELKLCRQPSLALGLKQSVTLLPASP